MSDANDIFPPERDQEDGWEIGFCKADLCRAVEVWFHANGTADGTRPLTVGAAAEVFNVTPDFLADALDHLQTPFFFASENDDPAARILDCDGL